LLPGQESGGRLDARERRQRDHQPLAIVRLGVKYDLLWVLYGTITYTHAGFLYNGKMSFGVIWLVS